MASTVTETVARQPDIEYAPNYAKYQARREHRLRTEALKEQTLPAGFPQRLESDLVWEGADIANKYNWTHEFSAAEVAEIEQALEHFKALGKPLGHLSPQTFPLPTLHGVLREVSRELHAGHGFKVLRGVPVGRHSRADNVIMYAGLSAHIAPVRARQDNKWDGRPADVVVTHIKNLTADKTLTNIGSPAYTADKQVFHTDTGDIVSLMALSAAAQGGTSRLASTWRVYNELAATRPDLVQTLAQDWTAEIVGYADQRSAVRPLLYHQPPARGHPERVVLQYARRNFTGFGAIQRAPDLPPITEAQAEALDTLHYLGEKFGVGLDFRAGDIQYLNNLAIFHARDGFTDTPEQQRHLLRLWLRDPENAWDTPEQLKERWMKLYDGITEESQVFPLEPFVRSASNALERAKS